MVNKKAYIKTIEALIAVLMLIGFLIYILPSQTSEQQTTTALDTFMDNILDTIIYDSTYRDCSIDKNTQCLKDFIDQKITYTYDYRIQICDDSTACDTPSDLPDKNIYVDDRIITTDYEYENQKTVLVKLYMWYTY